MQEQLEFKRLELLNRLSLSQKRRMVLDYLLTSPLDQPGRKPFFKKATQNGIKESVCASEEKIDELAYLLLGKLVPGFADPKIVS